MVLPLDYDLSLKATAQITGVSVGWVSRLRNAFIRGERVGNDTVPARGGRHHAHFTPEQEAELLEPFLERARTGGVLVVSEVKPALEAALGRPMALSTVYNLLHRHGWRKLAPDKRHPQSDPQAQQDWKKLPEAIRIIRNNLAEGKPITLMFQDEARLWPYQRRPSMLGAQTDPAGMPGHADARIHLRLCGGRRPTRRPRYAGAAARQHDVHAALS